MAERDVVGSKDLNSVGLVGLGVMGSGIARSILRAGYPVAVFSRDPMKTVALAQAGARPCTLAELGQRCQVVVMSVSDAAAVEEVLFAPGKLACGLRPGSHVIDTSTIGVCQARSFATRLAAMGIIYLDAPVSGGEKRAHAGQLVSMVGGDRAAFDKLKDLFSAYCRRSVHMGASGSGQVAKAANQIAVSACLLGVAESMAFTAANGVDPNAARTLMLEGTANSYSLEMHGERMLARDFEPGFRVELMQKDLRLSVEQGTRSGMAMPTTTLALELLGRLVERGLGDQDISSLAMLFGDRGS